MLFHLKRSISFLVYLSSSFVSIVSGNHRNLLLSPFAALKEKPTSPATLATSCAPASA